MASGAADQAALASGTNSETAAGAGRGSVGNRTQASAWAAKSKNAIVSNMIPILLTDACERDA
jgi:hypothetical protein